MARIIPVVLVLVISVLSACSYVVVPLVKYDANLVRQYEKAGWPDSHSFRPDQGGLLWDRLCAAHNVYTDVQGITFILAVTFNLISFDMAVLVVTEKARRRFLLTHKWKLLVTFVLLPVAAFIVEFVIHGHLIQLLAQGNAHLSGRWLYYVERSHFPYTVFMFLGICGWVLWAFAWERAWIGRRPFLLTSYLMASGVNRKK
jgi:hypothetical protein